MEQHIDRVVAPGLKAGDVVVEAEADDAEWSVGAVGIAGVDGGAPEVVPPDAGKRSRG